MSPPIRDGSGSSIGSIRLGDGSEISEVRTGAGDVLFSEGAPDPVTDFTTAGDGGFSISTGTPLSISHDNEGAGDAGGMASKFVVDLDGVFSGGIVEVQFRTVDFDKNSTGSNHLVVGFGDIAPDAPARFNGNGIYYVSEASGSDDTFNLVQNGLESRNKISNINWSTTRDITVRVDDTGTNTVAELDVDGSVVSSKSDMFKSDVNVLFQLLNDETLSNACTIDEIGIVKL